MPGIMVMHAVISGKPRRFTGHSNLFSIFSRAEGSIVSLKRCILPPFGEIHFKRK